MVAPAVLHLFPFPPSTEFHSLRHGFGKSTFTEFYRVSPVVVGQRDGEKKRYSEQIPRHLRKKGTRHVVEDRNEKEQEKNKRLDETKKRKEKKNETVRQSESRGISIGPIKRSAINGRRNDRPTRRPAHEILGSPRNMTSPHFNKKYIKFLARHQRKVGKTRKRTKRFKWPKRDTKATEPCDETR